MNPRPTEQKIIPATDARALGEKLRSEGKRLVTTNGCFDLLHWGHMTYLADARRLGDVLWVGVNGNASLRHLKGSGRPLTDELTRARQLAALECVDYVTVFQEDTPVEWLQQVRPQLHAKGGDYAGKTVPEEPVLKSWGGNFLTVPFVPGFSTTSLIEKIRALKLL